MRWIFFSFLLLNFLVLALIIQNQGSPDNMATRVSPGLHKDRAELSVIAKAGLDEENHSAGNGKLVDPDALMPACVRITGIEQRLVRQLEAFLETMDLQIKRQGKDVIKEVQYWVMYPPFENPASATTTFNLLKKTGIGDFYLIRSGEYENAISLGIFSTRSAAEERRDKLAQNISLQVRPEIEIRHRDGERLWVEVDIPPTTIINWAGGKRFGEIEACR